MITEKFTKLFLVKIDNIWRPVRGEFFCLNDEWKVKFILNGKLFEENRSKFWLFFDEKKITFAKLKNLAITYNTIDMDNTIAICNSMERQERLAQVARGTNNGEMDFIQRMYERMIELELTVRNQASSI